MPFDNIEKTFFSSLLKPFDFVMWDRYTYDKATRVYRFYSWIDRDFDFYKDFIVLTFHNSEAPTLHFITSSAKHDNKLKEIFGLVDLPKEIQEEMKCKRVQDIVLQEFANVIRI